MSRSVKPRTRRRAALVAGFAVYFALVWLLWYSPVVYPLKIFVVFLHEVSHGLVAVATGGRIESIVLSPREGGACYCPGGSAFLTLSSGYLGSLAWGVGLVASARARRVDARWLAGGVGTAVLLLTGLYVRGTFGVAFGILFGGGMLASSRFLGRGFNRGLVRVLGLTSALYVLLDIRSDVLDRPHLPSDAAMLADLTGVPTLLWGLIWMIVALGTVGWMLHRSWHRA